MSKPLNVANRLTKIAELYPNSIAVAESNGRQMTFAELEADTNRIAAALLEQGAEPGMKLALFVHYGIDFLLLVFALCKAGIVIVLIDPGMGIKRMLNCLAEVEPDGFVAVPVVHFVRWFYSKKFPKAKFN
ncbi:MAG: AMP-binding protein, partial [Planctomycetaceae bacterium]|nr:AMP-binding protein [Planctomycetaceae bacterium]